VQDGSSLKTQLRNLINAAQSSPVRDLTSWAVKPRRPPDSPGPASCRRGYDEGRLGYDRLSSTASLLSVADSLAQFLGWIDLLHLDKPIDPCRAWTFFEIARCFRVPSPFSTPWAPRAAGEVGVKPSHTRSSSRNALRDRMDWHGADGRKLRRLSPGPYFR
jgi:hypothetical protein